ncbi:MAG TPA: hypothetical protein VN519_05315 [Bryobacteraceae bacterium]|nr:hypothetical protein [Bryobacteraceae bacterium]
MAQHDDTNYSASNRIRANVTTHIVNITASATASETFVYDQTGSLVTANALALPTIRNRVPPDWPS